MRICEAAFMPFMVLHKGDGDRGLIMIKQNVIGDGCRVHTQLRDMEDRFAGRKNLRRHN